MTMKLRQCSAVAERISAQEIFWKIRDIYIYVCILLGQLDMEEIKLQMKFNHYYYWYLFLSV